MTPRTTAGRALAEHLDDVGMTHVGAPPGQWDDAILAIEAEASALDVERLAAALETPEVRKWLRTGDSGTRLHIAMLIAEADAAAYARNEAGEEEAP